MGWRQRFDPRRIRLAQLRDQARRINPQVVRQQIGAIRRAGFRSEVLVPIAAALILIFALVLSRFAADPASEIARTPTQPPVTGLDESPTPTLIEPGDGGYPFATATITATDEPIESSDVGTPTAVLTDTAIALDPSTGYPGPGDAPEPLGPPPDGGFPDVPTPDFGEAAPGGVQPFPTPALIPTVPGSGTTGTGYPPPAIFPTPQPARPQPQPPASGAFPTPAPGVPTPPTDDGTTTEPGVQPAPVESPAASPAPAAPDVTSPPLTPTPEPTPLPPTEPPRTGKVLTGNLRWSAADSPVRLSEDHAIAAGSVLTIDPGVEVQLAPGVRLTVAGTLRAQGSAAAPVRFVGAGGRWDAIVGVNGSTIILEGVQIRQSGANGVAISATGGVLAMRDTLLAENNGGIVSIGSAFDLRTSQIAGNAISGPAVNVQIGSAPITIVGNIIRDNATPPGGAQIRLGAGATAAPITIEGNSLGGGAGFGLLVETDVPLGGAIRCNAFNGGVIGLQISTNVPDASGFQLAIDNNSFVGQARYGAAGTLAFNLLNNWWGDPSGPLDARRNPQGRGIPVGVNLLFQPWLTERPACAPQP